jgi:hypothetical protein
MSSISRTRLRAIRASAWIAVILCAVFSTSLVVVDVMGTDTPAEVLSPHETPAVLAIDHDGYCYTYHVVTGSEALFDVTRDPERLINLLSDRPLVGRRLRGLLEEREKVEDLGVLRGSYRTEIADLRTLGYL